MTTWNIAIPSALMLSYVVFHFPPLAPLTGTACNSVQMFVCDRDDCTVRARGDWFICCNTISQGCCQRECRTVDCEPLDPTSGITCNDFIDVTIGTLYTGQCIRGNYCTGTRQGAE
ncbi:MAG: hypothetical protein QXI19_01610 [Candidatus Caldarchaeum sp.]